MAVGSSFVRSGVRAVREAAGIARYSVARPMMEDSATMSVGESVQSLPPQCTA
jgi:hypothetical protein